MSIEALSGKVFLVITGASRGIGRQIAITFGSLLQEGSHILLLARDLNALQETAKSISSKIIINVRSMDLSKATKNDLKEAILESLKGTVPEAFDRVVIVHNVGSLGPLKLLNEMTDVNEWRTHYDLNLFVPAILNAVIMNVFDDRTNTKKVVINITSLFAINMTVEVGYYCTVKAAREMYFKVFALENPDVNVLSYAPGPVDTDMFHTLCNDVTNLANKQKYCEIRDTKIMLSPEQTINKLVEVLKAHKYKSADHVDYYDPL